MYLVHKYIILYMNSAWLMTPIIQSSENSAFFVAMKVLVSGASCATLPSVVHETWGSVLCEARAPPSHHAQPLCSAVSGKLICAHADATKSAAADASAASAAAVLHEGSDVIALVERSTCASSGETVAVKEVFPMPRGLSYSRAACLPLQLLTVTAALQSAQLLGTAGKRVLIAGSSGTMPNLLLQMLAQHRVSALVAGLGSRPESLCASADASAGASALDAAVGDFSARVLEAASGGDLAAVIDVLGAEDQIAIIEVHEHDT